MPGPMTLPPHSAGVSELLDAAYRVWRATLPKCLPLAMVAVVVMNVPLLYARSAGHAPPSPFALPRDPIYWGYYAIGMIAYLFVGSVAIGLQHGLAREGRADFGAAVGRAATRLPALLAAMVLAYLAVALGTMLLIVPGVYVAVGVFLIWYVVLFDTTNPVQALVRSLKLAHPLWWKLFAAIVIGLLVMLVSTFAAMLVAALLVGLVLPATTPAGGAVAGALGVAFMGAGLLFVTALGIVLHSAASSSD